MSSELWKSKTAFSPGTSRSTLQQTKSQLGFHKDSLSRDVYQRLNSLCDWRHTSAQLFAGGWKVIFCLYAVGLAFVRSVEQVSREIQGHSLPACIQSRGGHAALLIWKYNFEGSDIHQEQ